MTSETRSLCFYLWWRDYAAVDEEAYLELQNEQFTYLSRLWIHSDKRTVMHNVAYSEDRTSSNRLMNQCIEGETAHYNSSLNCSWIVSILIGVEEHVGHTRSIVGCVRSNNGRSTSYDHEKLSEIDIDCTVATTCRYNRLYTPIESGSPRFDLTTYCDLGAIGVNIT